MQSGTGMKATTKNTLTGTELGRFKVEELLGKGGMGEVYRGSDQLLGRSVALKVMGRQQRMSPLTKTRFFREAQILSRLSHPNICAIYDIIERDDYDLLVLEFIEGQTLREALREGDDPTDPLAIAETLATVLAVAHKAHIVHRDLKPDNVMLLPNGDVKVLDFGLARPVGPAAATWQALDEAQAATAREYPHAVAHESIGDDSEATGSASHEENLRSDRTTHGTVVGTPRYMSPEQARGEEATAASDMYAFGILLQEMLTGQPAYKKNLPYHALLMKVGKGERRPIDPGKTPLDPDLIALINALTRLEPADRIDATQACRRLADLREKPKRRRSGRRRIVAGVALVTLLAVTIVTTLRLNRPVPLMTGNETLSAALLPLVNQTEEKGSEWIERGLGHLLQEQLDTVPRLHLLSADTVTRALADKPYRQELQQAQVTRLSHLLGADLLIQAFISKDPITRQYRLIYHLYRNDKHVQGRDILAQSLPQAVRAMTEQVHNRFHPEREMAPNHGEVFSEDPYALMIWSMGFHQLQAGDPASARHYFEICVERDPDFLKAVYSLAAAHAELGNYEEMRKLCHDILERGDIDPDLTLKANVYTLLGDLAKHDGNWDKTHYYYQLAKDLYQKNDHPDGFANALNRLGIIYLAKGDLKQAESFLMQALAIFREQNNRVDAAQIIQNLGLVASAREDATQARKYYEEALALAIEMQDRQMEAANYNNLAGIVLDEGNFDQAEHLYQQALAIYEEVGHLQHAAYLLYNLARNAENRNLLDRAEHLNMQALDKHQKLQEPFLRAHIHQLTGVIALKRDQLDTAEDEFTQALKIFKEIENARGIRTSRLLLAELLIGRDQSDRAAELIDQCAEIDPDLNRLKFLRALLRFKRGEHRAAYDDLEALHQSHPEVFALEESYLIDWMRRYLDGQTQEPLPMRARLLQWLPNVDPAVNPN